MRSFSILVKRFSKTAPSRAIIHGILGKKFHFARTKSRNDAISNILAIALLAAVTGLGVESRAYRGTGDMRAAGVFGRLRVQNFMASELPI
jgi:hypothetical protein